jgi:hypothetical protein
MSSISIIDLDSLVAPIGKVMLDGHEHKVLPFDGASYHLLSQLQRAQGSNPAEQTTEDSLKFLEIACKLAHRIVPSLTDEQVSRLNDRQLAAILQLGAGQVELVQKMMKESELGNVKPLATTKGKKARVVR